MKVILTFKTPDIDLTLSDDERSELKSVLARYVKYNEYVSIEFDSETCTARVVEQ